MSEVNKTEEVKEEVKVEAVEEKAPALSAKEKKKLEREQKRKTLSEKLRYNGKYELLPEKELQKQLRFYRRRFSFKYAAYFTAIPALLFTYAAITYNTLLALLVILIVLPGLLWGILGAIRVRGFALIVVLIGLGLNVLSIALSINPLIDAIPKIGEVFRLIMEHITSSFGGTSA